MEIDCQILDINEFSKICRLCLVNRELKPLTEQEKSTLIKLTPRITELDTNVFFPNKICSDCAIHLQQVNEFLQRCTMLTNNFHECIEKYRESVRNNSKLPSLEAIFFTTEVEIKQEVEEDDHEYGEEVCTSIPFAEVLMRGSVKGKQSMEFDDRNGIIPQQTTNNQSIESTSDITAPELLNKNDFNLKNNADNDTPVFTRTALIIGMSAACRRQELSNITVEDVQIRDDVIIIKIPDTKTKKPRTSCITQPSWINIIRHYISLRPEGIELTRFFLFYSKNKCTRQPVGIHAFGNMPSKIATFLGLENPEEYTGHCFRSSANALVRLKCLVRGCNGLEQGAKKHYLPYSQKHRENWLRKINRLEILNVPFTRSKNWSICSKHFASSAYTHPGSKNLLRGAEPKSPFSPFPTREKAAPKAVVEYIHIECKKTSAELCTDDVLRKTIKTYKRRRLPDKGTSPYYIDLTK